MFDKKIRKIWKVKNKCSTPRPPPETLEILEKEGPKACRTLLYGHQHEFLHSESKACPSYARSLTLSPLVFSPPRPPFLKAIRSCRKHLDQQVEQNFARAEKEKREAEILRAEERERLAQHEAHQAELKQESRKKLLVRAYIHVRIASFLLPYRDFSFRFLSKSVRIDSVSCRTFNCLSHLVSLSLVVI